MPSTTAHGRTIGVGHVHTSDADGLCLETCPHPTHAGPVIVMMPAPLKTLFDEFISNLGTSSTFEPTPPDEVGGMRVYSVITHGTPAAQATEPGALSTLLLERGKRAAERRARRT